MNFQMVNIATPNSVHNTCVFCCNGDFIIQHVPASVSIPTESGILPLHTAASSGNVLAVKALLNIVPDQVNYCTNSGETPLIAAASRGHNETVKLLLCLSANVNHRLPCGLTALWVALQNHHEEAAVTLINHTESNLMFILDNRENILHEAVKHILTNHGVNLLQWRHSYGQPLAPQEHPHRLFLLFKCQIYMTRSDRDI